MSQNYGRAMPSPHVQPIHREAAHYLVVIDSGKLPLARLLDAKRRQVAEFDANTEEATTLMRGVTPSRGATDASWDSALSGHSEDERRGAIVYELPT